jgi:hypothetical protein
MPGGAVAAELLPCPLRVWLTPLWKSHSTNARPLVWRCPGDRGRPRRGAGQRRAGLALRIQPRKRRVSDDSCRRTAPDGVRGNTVRTGDGIAWTPGRAPSGRRRAPSLGVNSASGTGTGLPAPPPHSRRATCSQGCGASTPLVSRKLACPVFAALSCLGAFPIRLGLRHGK